MIREAIDKIISLAPPETFTINGETYCEQQLKLVQKPEYSPPTPLIFFTLQAIVDYVAGNIDDTADYSILIVGPYRVRVIGPLQPENANERFIYASARSAYEPFEFGRFMPADNFVVALQSLFEHNETREDLLSIVGNLANEQITQAHDDGISQAVQIKSGITTRAAVILENPVTLQPYRTFPEIEQPLSEFIIRFKNDGNNQMQVALFEADGGMWQLTAIARIKQWLKGQAALKEVDIIG